MIIPSADEVFVGEDRRPTTRWYEWLLGNEAWTPFTSTVTAASGTITTASGVVRHRKVGRTVHVNIRVAITTNGTGATNVQATLPFVSGPSDQVLSGRETASTGDAVTGTILAGSGAILIVFYDGSYPGANGRTFVLTGAYEAAK